MTSERWGEVEALFYAACERTPDERAAFLEEACGADVVLKRAVEALVSAHEEASGFLEPPAARRALESDLAGRLQAALGAAYTVKRELGGGGMSRVFVAEETALGRDVVVKVLAPEMAGLVNVRRFRREIQLVGKLQQANIVPVLTTGEVDGLPYFTMPYVEGESLRARLAGGSLPVADAVSILKDVARALAYAHRHGVIHRDVKPENVLLSEGVAVVTDFGIAKAIAASCALTPEQPGEALTQIGTSVGTPAYMAPEQGAGDPATDHRADLYAFGAMAYELLGGRPPFHGLSPQKLLAARMSECPRPVGELRPDTPPALAELVMRCLEKDVEARPQSAAEVLQVLEAVERGGTHVTTPVVATRCQLRTALGIYTMAFIGFALLAWAASELFGLAVWVLPGVLIAMALVLPVVILTGSCTTRRESCRLNVRVHRAGGDSWWLSAD